MRILFAIFIIIFTSKLHATITFQKTYGGTGGDYGYSLQQTTDGGYIIAGYTNSSGAGNNDFYLIKTDSLGDTLWTKTFGGVDYDYGSSVCETQDSGFVIAGETWSNGGSEQNVYLIRTNASGDTLWTKTYGGGYDAGYSVAATCDGGFIVTGTTGSYGAGGFDIWLIKTNALGDTLWTKVYGGSNLELGYSVAETEDKGYIIAGVTASFGLGAPSAFNTYLIRTDSLGDTLWTKVYGGIYDDVGSSVQQTQDGGFIIVGNTESFGAGSSDIYLLKTDSSGDTLWTKTYGGTFYDYGSSVQQTNDDGFIITGNFGENNGDVYLIKTDSLGDTLWTKTYGGWDYDVGNSVQSVSGGISGFIIAGATESFGAGGSDVYLIKTDSAGNVGIEETSSVGTDYNLSTSQNPFRNNTIIKFNVGNRNAYSLKIYDITGSPVKTLIPASPSGGNEQKRPGTYTVNFDAKDLPSGIYFAELKTGDYRETKKLILMK